ncbi:MAG TPA: nuclease-related domain-containing protein [Hyphomicrobiaceae bacterium]|jgi:hypothetical protein
MEPEAIVEPELRAAATIFEDLRELAQSDGALHEISALIYRDWVLAYDVKESRVAIDPEQRWSTSRLNNNELMLLLGLTVQCRSDRTYSVEVVNGAFGERADQLLRELHNRIAKDAAPTFDKKTQTLVERAESLGLVAREGIYYGADSFYLHQFLDFSRNRYREDGTWLLQNVGISIGRIAEIARFIVDRINRQMTAIGQKRKDGETLSHGDLTNSLLIAKSDLRKKFGGKADAFLAKFATLATNANRAFIDPFAINQMTIAPIIDLGEHVYVPNQYRLYETIYESPFYWMMADKSYRDTAAANRGAFLEHTTAHIFRSVFGVQNVYENVTIRDGSRDIAGEVDVLVVYGEFVLVIQAKSKRVTLKARAGDTEALRADFDGAIQAPYQQALKCAELIRQGCECRTRNGDVLPLPPVPRLFPVVTLSDPFPSSTSLSHRMLERGNGMAPVIWDLGVLDCVARILPTPIEMLFYLKSRSDVFGTVVSDSEYNFLGYHLRAKLATSREYDMMMLDRDFATVVDDYMVAADLGVTAKRPRGVLERLDIPIISDLLAALKTAEPRLASIVIDLYDFSGAALKELSETIAQLRQEIAATGKPIKALSIPTATGGFTYAVTRDFDPRAAAATQAIAAKHKYDTKRDRWYVILDSIETKAPIDALLPLVWPWKENEVEAKNSLEVAKLFGTREVTRKPLK